MQYQTHIAKDGERWDTLAAKYFGAAFLYPQIMAANALLCQKPALDAGDIVKIPIVETEPESTTFTSEKDVPPWNR